jgi:O-antigen ligase
LTRLAAAGLGLGLVFLAYSLAWDPSFLLRLTTPAEEGDYGSGRLPSVAYWLGLAGERPFGLGFGAVREMLAEIKPWLDGASTLEWPHNEFVRLYVEAGPLGLGFALVLVVALARTALRAAARDPGGDPVRRTLMLAIAADVVAESCLQNLFNAVLHATVLVVFLALAAAATRSTGRASTPATNSPGQVPVLAPT